MTALVQQWQSFGRSFDQLSKKIAEVSTVNVNSSNLRREAESVAMTYFQEVQPMLDGVVKPEHVGTLHETFEAVLTLTYGANKKSSYEKYLKRIKKVVPKIAGQLVQHRGSGKSSQITSEDQAIIGTLNDLVPSASLSYRQALADLADEKRLSYRGAALEMREALRETLDHLAPDKDVTAADWYVQEKDRHGPTMKQKVRFIMKARGIGKTAAAAPENAATGVENAMGALTRSVYDLSSVAAHVSLERQQVARVRRYVVAVLHDILMI